MDFTWLETERRYAPPALTVRAQTVSPNDRGILRWDTYFPRVDVESIDLSEIITLDDRPVADRRDWNGPGRLIPINIPALKGMEITPIEAYDAIGEREIQKLNERTGGNAQLIRDQIGVTIPRRSDRLSKACYRRIEVDAFAAWALGTVTVRSPQDATKKYTVSLNYDPARLQTAPTAWNDGGSNAYNNLIAWCTDAIDAVGGIEGVMLRLPLLNEILRDAPPMALGVPMTRAQLADRIGQDLAQPFRFELFEDMVDIFDDGGVTTTRTKVWAAGRLAAIPQGTTVGSSYFAPVARAMELANVEPAAAIDVNGVSVFYESTNSGKELQIQSQLNALSVPSEQLVYVINTLVGV